MAEIEAPRGRLVAWTDGEALEDSLEALIDRHRR